ncbi:MAG: GAP family protein [Yaniella sp.]|uniref:GAP family protein n=1 Tax=Yaniella sp. TaxID=2773929 RepID=UPI002648A3EC|nr:GAP family protein [Yaniella sp.]MDN5704741.1 GAP family protein [Yaniella sp.]MDN5731412.1 GAP family protein [Yaniella sp.]MDN5815327.1 GAP family protein [Yaniella sp.]MDN5817929.1 GAP family protein [Yaniella sp.]MDN5838230.1 GAP family protein [Yaniella sp.]
MGFVSIAALVGLAFLDASTLSTLLIPLWLLARPGAFQPRRLVTYLTVTAGTYFLLGFAVLVVAHQFIDAYLATLQSPLAGQVAIGLGAVVIVMGIIGLLRSRREAQPGTSAMTRLRDRALESRTSVATLAFSAIVIEVATMWPYLVGISLIAANGPGLPLDIFWLALYNVIMVLPASILTWARTKYPEQTGLLLSKTRETMTSAGSNFTAWLAILIGAWIIIAQLL